MIIIAIFTEGWNGWTNERTDVSNFFPKRSIFYCPLMIGKEKVLSPSPSNESNVHHMKSE